MAVTRASTRPSARRARADMASPRRPEHGRLYG